MIALATCSRESIELVHIAPEPETLPMITVCAWCFPMQRDYFRAHPEHAGRILTHTICPDCQRKVLAGTYRR